MMTIFLISAIFLVTLLAAWRDYQTCGRLYRALIIIVSGGLLIGYLVEPEWQTTGNYAKYAVISDGFETSGFSSSNYDSVYSIQSKKSLDASPTYDRWLSSLHFLPLFIPNGSTIDFYGYGTNEDLPAQIQWNNKLITPEPGIVLVKAPHQVETGNPFEISVSPISAGVDDTLAVFRDGQQIYSETTGGENTISFTDELYSPGPSRYRFEWQHADTLIIENRNIRAIRPERLSIAALLYSPSFEINHFQETLAGRGHRFSSRIRLGENQFRFDNLNAPPVTSEELLSDNLNRFDLLILDLREYAELTEAERNSVGEALRSGLDILLTPPTVDEHENWTAHFHELSGKTLELNRINRLTERLWFPGILSEAQQSDILRIPLINADFDFENDNFESLFEYNQNQPIAVRYPVDKGSITAHLFYQTYRWLLRGEPGLFNRFWAQYLGSIITRESPFLEISTLTPRKDQKTVITSTSGELMSELEIFSAFSGSTTSIPVVQRGENPNVDYANFWPTDTGWHRADYRGNDAWFYVYDEDWKFDFNYKFKAQTERSITDLSNKNSSELSTGRQPVSDWIWLLGFLFLQVVLWAERKFV